MPLLRPQSVVLTLYGDYIRYRGGEVWVGSLIKLLGSFGLSEQAIRSALSRMCRKGLLRMKRVGKNSYYSLTAEGETLLAKGARRIFHRSDDRWDGTWHIVTYSIPEAKREVRDRLRQELVWMGFGPLGNSTWLSPYDLSWEVEELAGTLGINGCLEMFRAQHLGFATSGQLVRRLWDVDRIHQGYASFLTKYTSRYEEHLRRLRNGEVIAPSECFVERFMFIHEYRRFPFFDPELPLELLPQGWPRPQAAALFQAYHNLLAEPANKYFDSVFEKAPLGW